MARTRFTLNEPDPGTKEGRTLYRIIRLMACSGLVAGSLWWPEPSLAAKPGAPGLDGLLLAEAPDVAKQRVLDFLDEADRAWQSGDRNEAVRLGLAADSLARKLKVEFDPSERSPGSVLAGFQGLAGARTPARAEQSSEEPAIDIAASSPEETHRRVQELLRAAESDVRAGRTQEALQKATTAQQLAVQQQVKFGALDVRPEHIVSAVRRIDPTAQMPQPTIQTVGFDAPAATPSTPAAGTSPKAQVTELLAAARDAMDRGSYDEARDYALQARQFDGLVTYGVLDDRPDYLLREIETLSQSIIIPAGGRQPITAGGTGSRDEALALMQEAQARLEQGDVDGAEQLAMQAQQLDATYDLTDPRPEVMLQDISHWRGSQATVAGTTGGNADQAQAAAFVQAGRTAMQQGDFETAQQYALEASRFEVTYGLLEDNPEKLMADIARFSGQGAPAGGEIGNEHALARQLLAEARSALVAGDVDSARRLAMQADSLDVPYDVVEDRPDLILAELERFAPSTGTIATSRRPAVQDEFVVPPGATAASLFQQGVAALRSGDRDGARGAFQAAWQSGQELDPVRQQQLQDFLAELSTPSGIQQASNSTVTEELGSADTESLLGAAGERREIRSDRLRTQVLDAVFQAEKLRDTQPEKAIELLNTTSAEINAAAISEEDKTRLLASLESAIASIESHMATRAPLIELERRNAEVRARIALDRTEAVRVEQELAKLVDQYGDLMDQRRYAEAHHIARQAKELDPQNPVVVQMFYQSMFQGRQSDIDEMKDGKERMAWQALHDVDRAMVHSLSDDHPLQFGDDWQEIIARRKGTPTDAVERTEEELRIRSSLNMPVSLHFQEEPLVNVLDYIANNFLINVQADSEGLLENGITSDTPVTINVDGIRLQSALNLILGPLDLNHTIENEVLWITSRLREQGEMVTQAYQVADLVVPIPVEAPVSQFRPGSGFGMPGASGPSATGVPNGGFGQVPDPTSNQFPIPGLSNGSEKASQAPNYDFEGLVNLITHTIEPDSWDVFAGQATITQHESTLSLVIRQTQRVHQEIADLLTQLRRLQDLQVTIEVRFITVSDRFFERIGIDFDFNVQDSVGGPVVNDDFTPLVPFGLVDPNFGASGGTGQAQQGQAQQGAAGGGAPPFGPVPQINIQGRDSWPGRTIVGMSGENTFSPDLDIPFSQGSFGLGVPDFGGFQADAGISFGLAILSDIEAFLFVNAAQGDERSNIMFAPKLTLFNGQLGTIVSALIRPFVVSVVPIASGLVVGFQPIIQTIPDGAVLTVRAVISADRRYVRLSVSPQFTNITDVFTFSFIGGGGGIGVAGNAGVGGGLGAIGAGGQQGGQQAGQQQQQGQAAAAGAITVQQPVTDVVTVSTVVSVPDGGTVLLGGVKRLREGRTMAGVPIMNKIPYISRLFKNTGVGRETDSLMLMVTPRIIIGEEEEELLFGG
jgi:general secretion pathway protein D